MNINITPKLHNSHSRPKQRSLHDESGVCKGNVCQSATVNKKQNNERMINKPADKIKFCGFFDAVNKTSKGGPWTWLGNRKGIQNYIKSEKFDKLLEKANDLAKFEGLLMCLISVTIKPITIMALPAKEDDKKYAATKALLGGIVDYSIITAIVSPLTKIINKFIDKIDKDPNFVNKEISCLGTKVRSKNLKTVLGYMPKLLLIPLRSALTIALIPTTLKYMFPETAKKKAEKKRLENETPTQNKNVEVKK